MALEPLAKKGNFFHVYDFRVKPGTGDRFIDLFDGVFVVEVDLDTLNQRLAARTEDEWGGQQASESSLHDYTRQEKTFSRALS